MSKTKKQNKKEIKPSKTKIKPSKTKKQNKKQNKLKLIKRTIKRKQRDIILPTKTPKNINNISKKISQKIDSGSYSPTINNNLITLKSIPRKELLDCNIDAAYNLKEPLQIGIPGKIYGKYCHYYYTPEAKKFLLKNLSANKHLVINKIVPPIQSKGNCWFNAMFVTFFVSDKGRKFFHFLRQLMIEGKQKDGTEIPDKLRHAFALLNFAVDACLTGNEYAYKLNTNSVIELIYKAIPESYKKQIPYIFNVDDAGNPILYYVSIMNYLNNNSIQLLFIRNTNSKWKETLVESISKMTHLPHIIVLEIFEINAPEFNPKPVTFKVNNAKYQIDSAVIRDISKQHFCSTITCEGKEMAYDGMSFERLVPLEWKHKLNSNVDWQFEGTLDYDNTPLEWNFTKSYQMLIYYRV
jgi:hypothetical protein